MQEYFGDAIDDSGPMNFLVEADYTERAGMIYMPSDGYSMTEKEGDCLDFMCDEWDYAFTRGVDPNAQS